MARDILKHMRGWPNLSILAMLVFIGGVASAGWIHTTPMVVSHELAIALPGTLSVPSDGKPYEEDDPQPLQAPTTPSTWPCAYDFVGKKSAGPGLHVAIVSGNVFTQVPVLEVLGPRGTTLEVTLYYDSLRSHEDRGCGYGWSHSLLHTWYLVPGEQDEPDRIVIVDGTGRRRAHAEIDGDYFRPPAAAASVTNVQQHNLTIRADSGETYQFSNYQLSSITTPQGLVTTFAYDVNQRLQTVTDGYGRQVQFTYYANGQLETITDPANNTTTLTYDASNSGLLVGIEDPEEAETTFQYEVVTRGSDILHRMTRETLKNGNYFTCVYDDTADAMSRTIQDSSDPAQTIISVASAEFVMVRGQEIDDTTTVTVTDERGEVWEYERDAWWHLTKMTPPLDEPLEPGIDAPFATAVYGDDATNHPEAFAQLISSTDALGNQRSLSYDENGMVESVTDRLGYTTTYAYEYAWDHDNDGGAATPAIPMPAYLTEKILPGTAQPTWNYVYDPYRCDLTEVWDPIREDGQDLIATIDYTYYDETNPSLPGRLERVVQTDRNGYTTTYDYGTDGKLNTRTVQVATGTPAVEIVTTYVHDTLGRMTRETLDMGDDDDIITDYAYDKMGRITTVTRDPGDLALVTSYTYDDYGLLESTTDPEGTVTKYTYDHRNRLVTITEDYGQDRLNILTQYTYAADGTVTVTDPRGHSTQYEYDPRGRLNRVLDAEGYETLYEYDLGGNLLEVDRGRAPGTGGERDLRSFIYDSLGRVVHADTGDTSSGNQLRRSYVYPDTSCGCGGIGSSTPSVESIGSPTYQLDQVSREFDLMGRVEYVYGYSEQWGTTAAVTQYEYDPEGQVTKIWGPEGEEIEFTHDGAGRLITRRVLASEDGDPLVQTWLETSYTYDPAGNIKSIMLPNGHTLTGTYDTADRLRTVTEMDGQTQKTVVVCTYDDNGNIRTRTDGLNNTWTYEYDALNRLVIEYDPANETTEFDYDEMSNLVAMFDCKGICTRLVYDDLNRVTQKTEHTPTLAPQPLSGLLDPITPTLNTRTYFEYDGSRLIKLRDHDGNEMTYDFNDWGLLEKTTYPDAGDVDFVYDALGHLASRTDQNNVKMIYDFDQHGRMLSRSYDNLSIPSAQDPEAEDKVLRADSYEYDHGGRLIRAYQSTMWGGRPLEFERSYDLAGRVTSETLDVDDTIFGVLPYTTTVSYSINPATHVAGWTMTTPSGRQVVHEIDRLGRLFSAHDANNTAIGVDWTFDDASRRSTMSYRNNINLSKSYTYDGNGRVTELELTYTQLGVPTTLWGEHYGYDVEGNRTYTERLHEPGWSETYSYDSRHRLRHMYRGTLAADKQSVQTPLLDTRLASHQHWRDLDRRGNWLDYRATLSGTASMQARTATSVNEYGTFDVDGPSLPEPQVVLGYDDAGNLISDPMAPNWGDTSAPSGQTYVYDGENRLIEVIRSSDAEVLIEYEYDALGRRIHTIEHYDTNGDEFAPPRVTRHVYFGMEVIEEYILGEDEITLEETDTLAREFIWGDSASFPEPVVMIDYTEAGEVSAGTAEVLHYLHDVLGSVAALIDANGEIVERYTYDPYGKAFVEIGPSTTYPPTLTPSETSKYGNPFRWTGQRYDETVGLYSFLFRHYTPRHGRWLQRDPLGHSTGDVNFYQYVLASPMILVDPLGLCSLFNPPQWEPIPLPQPTYPRQVHEADERYDGFLSSTDLWKHLVKMCKAECASGTSKNKAFKGNTNRCMNACKREARRMLRELKKYFNRTKSEKPNKTRNCTAWSQRLEALFRRMNLKFFKFSAIELMNTKGGGGHVVFGLTNASSTATVQYGETDYEVWDLLFDFTFFNDPRDKKDATWYIIEGGTTPFIGLFSHDEKTYLPFGPRARPRWGGDYYGQGQGGTADNPWPDAFPAW